MESRQNYLLQLIHKYGTDKGRYAPVYEPFLRGRREEIRAVLEIGIGTMNPVADSSMSGVGASNYRPGASLRVWREYFPNAEIVGLDVEPDTQFTEPRIRTFLCNSTDGAAVARLMKGHDLGLFDLIIDDGSHRAADQVATLKNCFPHLSAEGMYVIEDVWEDLAPYDAEIIPVIGRSVMFPGSVHSPAIIQKVQRVPEFELHTEAGASARLECDAGKPECVRVVITGGEAREPWHIQLNVPLYPLAANRRYAVRFRASADRSRSMNVGVAAAHEPWSNHGLYAAVELTTATRDFQFEFLSTGSDRNARVHFDLGGAGGTVYLESVSLDQLPPR